MEYNVNDVDQTNSPQDLMNNKIEPHILSPQVLKRELENAQKERDCFSQNTINPLISMSIDSEKKMKKESNFESSPLSQSFLNPKTNNTKMDNSMRTFDSGISNGNQNKGTAETSIQGANFQVKSFGTENSTLDNVLYKIQKSKGKISQTANPYIQIQDDILRQDEEPSQLKMTIITKPRQQDDQMITTQPRQPRALSNIHNEQRLDQKLANMLQAKVVEQLNPNDASSHRARVDACHDQHGVQQTPRILQQTQQQGPVIEKKNFHDHFDMEKAMTLKCRICISYKLKDQRFIAKKLPKNIIELQDYYNILMDKKAIHSLPPYNISLMDPWIKMPPICPNQSYVTCHGIIKDHNDDLYVLSELISDYKLTQSELNKYEFKKNELRSSELSRNQTMSDYWMKVAQKHSDPIFMMLENNNSQAEQTSESYEMRSSLTRKIQMDIKNLKKLRKNQTYDIKPKRQDLILGTLSTDEDEEIMGRKHLTHFYGKRLFIKDLKISKNYYTVIKEMKLGNLSALNRIPEFYSKHLIQFIIDISGSMAHAHQHNLIHGEFNLSKIIAQKIKIEDSMVKTIIERRKVLNKKCLEELDFKRMQQNFEFQVTSFVPYKVIEEMMKQDKDEKDVYKKVTNVRKMKLDYENMLQLYKIKDLHRFANAIIEIMVGRCEEMNTGQEKNKGNGTEISLDSIPLNWGKIPEIQYIFQIIQLCYGPYNTHNNLRTNTSKIFKQINQIATNVFRSNYYGDQDLCSEEFTQIDVNRLKSVAYNNMAVSKFMSITDDSSQSQRQKVQIEMGQLLDQALCISPDNQIALLNQGLLGWSCGELRDDEFQNLVKYRIKEVDPEMAQLFFTLFKRDVVGGQIHDLEISALINQLESKNKIVSNITQQLFHHPHFAIFKKEKHNLKLREDQVIFMNNFPDEVYQYNHVIKLGKIGFSVKGMFFSNNDKFLMVFGSLAVIIIAVQTGQKIYEQGLPKTSRITNRDNFQEKPATKADAGQIKSPDHGQASVASSRTDFINVQTTQGNSRRNSGGAEDRETSNGQYTAERTGELDTQKGEESPGNQGPLDPMSEMVNDIILNKFKNLLNEHNHTNPNFIRLCQEEQEIEREFKKAFELYPMDWVGQVSDNGKSIALFDKGQQKRNLFCKFQQNRQEFMFVNANIQVRASFDSPSLHKVDLIYFLDRNEVLEFEFAANSNTSTENLIYIHAKNLKTYIIDYVLNMLVEVIEINQSYMLKSIFRTRPGCEQTYAQHEELKEKIQQWEADGVEVRLPKYNTEFIVLRAKGTIQISIYCLRQKRVIRNFLLNSDNMKFLDKVKVDESKTPSDDGDAAIREHHHKILFEQKIEAQIKTHVHEKFHTGDTPGRGWNGNASGILTPRTPGSPEVFGEQKSKSTIGAQRLISRALGQNVTAAMLLTQPALEHEKIKNLEVSSHGRILAAHVGAEVFIKVLNQARRDQCCNSINYHQSIAFMPLYRDYDYNTKSIIQKFEEEQEAKRKRDEQSDSVYDSMESEHEEAFELNSKNLEAFSRTYELLSGSKKHQMALLTRQEKMYELYPLVLEVSKNPQVIWKLKARKRDYLNKVMLVFEIFRGFQRIDHKSITLAKFNKLNYLFVRKQFHLKRSFEYIKAIICSSDPKRAQLGALINRKLKVYEFIQDKLLFEINIPNLDDNMLSQKCKNTLFFFDNDRIICAQDGHQRVAVVSVGLQIELQRATSTKPPTQNITFPLDSCENGLDMIDMGFARAGEKRRHAQADEKDDGDENSDGALQDIEGHCYIDFGEEIVNMFYTRNDAECSYLAILGINKIEIYFIQDDEQGCETNLEWRIEPRFDAETRSLGRITCLSFDDTKSESFATGSNLGQVGIWNVLERHLEWTIKILHPKTKSPENISMIRVLHREQVIITYSLKSQSLLLTEDKKQQTRIRHPVTTQLAFDPAIKGDLKGLAVDPSSAWIAATFENGSISVFSRRSMSGQPSVASTYEIVPQHIHTGALGAQVIMDQFFSYLCYIDESQKQVHFETFEWQFQLAKLEKHIFEEKKEEEPTALPSAMARNASMKNMQAAATQGFRDFFRSKIEVGHDTHSGQCSSSTCQIF